jgi:nitroreductase
MTSLSSRLLNTFLNRRSIRKFSSKPVKEADVRKIVEVGQRAPTACNLQTYSIVWVRNAKLREKVLDACGVFGTIRTAPIVFVICADVRRLARVLDYLNYDHCLKHGYGYSIKLMSIMDASFVAENMTMAAESLGLGSVFVGSAFANDKVIKALKLPSGVLPLTLLCVGYPDEQPPRRPRWALSSILHVDYYQDPAEHEIEAFLKHMDHELRKEGYYQKYVNRGPNYRYSNHIKRKTTIRSVKKDDAEVIPVVKKMGFLPKPYKARPYEG